jgi:hypothetical protein
MMENEESDRLSCVELAEIHRNAVLFPAGFVDCEGFSLRNCML